MERQGRRRQQQKVRSRILPKLVYRLASCPCGHYLARRCSMVACPSSSASLGGHLRRRQQKKIERGRPCPTLLLRLFFVTRFLADGRRAARCTMLKPAPSLAIISSYDTGRLLTKDFCVLVSMRSCEAFSQEQHAKQDARRRQRYALITRIAPI